MKGKCIMEYGYQKVLEVQRRCGVSFEDADRALKAEKGDADKACVYAMRRKNNKEDINSKIGSLSNFITYRIKISKNGKTKFDISMGIVLLISLIVFIFSLSFSDGATLFILYLLVFIITIFTGYSLIFTPGERIKEVKLETVAQDDIVKEAVEGIEVNEVENENDGFNTIEIE